MAYRSLGSNGAIDAKLSSAETYVANAHNISHNEGTCDSDCTTPTIGTGVQKLCRDTCMSGYSVGTTILDRDKTPFPLEFSTNHILCYDIESEFAGKGYCHYGTLLYVAHILGLQALNEIYIMLTVERTYEVRKIFLKI